MQQREEWVNTAVTEICNEHPVCTGCPLKLSPGQYYCSNDKYYAELLFWRVILCLFLNSD